MKLSDNLQWHEVTSSQISYIAHDEQGLFVKFINGGNIYGYPGVPAETFEQMKTADSVGKFLNSQIKPNFQFEKLQ